MQSTYELAQSAAALIMEEGLGFAQAKKKAAQSEGRVLLPSNEEVEAAIWEYISVFRSHEQAQELALLRELALTWMRRLDAFNPHIGGGVWHGWAGKMNAIELELYCPEQKTLEIFLLDAGIEFESAEPSAGASRPGRMALVQELMWWDRVEEWQDWVAIHAWVYEEAGIRGALLADKQGRTPRGSIESLMKKMTSN